MKKAIILFLALMMCLPLCACKQEVAGASPYVGTWVIENDTELTYKIEISPYGSCVYTYEDTYLINGKVSSSVSAEKLKYWIETTGRLLFGYDGGIMILEHRSDGKLYQWSPAISGPEQLTGTVYIKIS